ncbi:hypothetical protein GOODEAATRI_025263 [Goodea atripinnis]|uniref:Uncharacterized protein n=1 Tax=Goodea atripinnis TaxID=208336 RepID=A0ABV0NFS1_9TELE
MGCCFSIFVMFFPHHDSYVQSVLSAKLPPQHDAAATILDCSQVFCTFSFISCSVCSSAIYIHASPSHKYDQIGRQQPWWDSSQTGMRLPPEIKCIDSLNIKKKEIIIAFRRQSSSDH